MLIKKMLRTKKGKIRQSCEGYILFDVLLAIFLFSLGFTTLFGLREAALSEARQAADLLQGANLAQKTMDSFAIRGWQENFAFGVCVPGSAVQGQEGKFRWQIRSAWEDDSPLLRVTVEASWWDQGKPFCYKLEGLYGVE